MILKLVKRFDFWLLIAYLCVIPLYEVYRNYSNEKFSISILIQYVSGLGIGYLSYQNAKLSQNFEINKEILNFMKQSYENNSKDRLKEIKRYENRHTELATKQNDLDKRLKEIESKL